MKTRLYLDTSVPSSFFDTSKPVRQLITQKWFEYESLEYVLVSSVVAFDEIGRMSNSVKRDNILGLFREFGISVLDITDTSRKLARLYIENGAIPKSEIEDAYHIAIATENHIESLVSWNFKHIVSANPIRKIHQINLTEGFEEVVIGSPEMFGGYKYGNL